ncbi:MAG: TonB-dependent receptor [Candidatus Marinimicrobia bacterium]|nr:TonB-dependent receptor [Candidatus Neomarinimicrobiota bacterium]
MQRRLSILFFFFFLTSNINAAVIEGQLNNASTNEPLFGANVFLVGTNHGAATDDNGSFRVEDIPAGRYTLVASYVGYEQYSEKVNLSANESLSLNLSLEPTALSMERVTVTANRTSTPISEIGNTITVIGEGELRLKQPTTVDQAIDEVPGMVISKNGGSGNTTYIRTRGFTNKHMLVMIDGIRITNPTAFSSEFYIDNLTMTGVERIEVLRGPQSGVYGTDAMAGVLNIITKRGEGPPRLNTFLEGGSFNTYHGGGNFLGSYENLSYNLYGSHLNTQGVSQSALGPDNDEKDGYTNTHVGGSLRYQFIEDSNTLDNLSLQLLTRYIASQNETDQKYRSLMYQGEEVFGAIVQDSQHEVDGDEIFFATRLHGDLFDGLLKNEFTYSAFNSSSVTDLQDSTISESEGLVNSFDYQSNITRSLTNPFLTEISAALGYEYEMESGDFSNIQFVDSLENDEISSNGVYANTNLTFGLNFHLNLAGRSENNSEFGTFNTYRIAGAWEVPMGGSFRITKLRASFGTGFESPSLQQLYLEGPFTYGNPDLEPEYSEMWDVGVHFSAVNNAFNGEITYYNGFANDGIFAIPAPELGNFAYQMQNIDSKVVMQGIETSFLIRPVNSVNIQLNYTWAESILEESDTQLFERPEHLGSIFSNVQITPTIDAGITFTYRGSQLASYPSGYEMDGFTKTDITVNYDLNDTIDLYTQLNNITNTDYQERLGFNVYGRHVNAGIRAQF